MVSIEMELSLTLSGSLTVIRMDWILLILSRRHAFINVEIFQVPKDNQTIIDSIAII